MVFISDEIFKKSQIHSCRFLNRFGPVSKQLLLCNNVERNIHEIRTCTIKSELRAKNSVQWC